MASKTMVIYTKFRYGYTYYTLQFQNRDVLLDLLRLLNLVWLLHVTDHFFVTDCNFLLSGIQLLLLCSFCFGLKQGH